MDNAANFFLAFSHDTVIIPLMLIGYIWLDQKVFYNGICLVLVSILFNFALKITFKVPLPSSLGKQGFSFPSGHMQSAVVLYGWLITKTHIAQCKILMIGLITGIGWSLIYSGYHYFVDILGALCFGVLLIFLYAFLADKKNKVLPWIVFSFSTILMLYIGFTAKIIEHLWMAYYALIGVSLSENFFSKRPYTKDLYSKILSTILCFFAVFIIKINSITNLLPFMLQAQWALIGFCIPCSVFISSYIIHHMIFLQKTRHFELR